MVFSRSFLLYLISTVPSASRTPPLVSKRHTQAVVIQDKGYIRTAKNCNYPDTTFFVQIHSTICDKLSKALQCTCSPCLHKAPYTVGWWWGRSRPTILLLIQLVAGCKLALADENLARCPRWRHQTSKSGRTCLRTSKGGRIKVY